MIHTNSKKIKKYLQVIVSLIVLFVVLKWIDPGKLIPVLKEINYNLLIISFFILTIDRILMAFKWNILLRAKNIRISLFEITKIYYMSNFTGLILPSTIGSDLIRTHFVVKRKNAAPDVVSSIIIERIIGLIALLIYVLFSIPLLIQIFQNANLNSNRLILLVIALTLISILTFLLTFNDKILNFLKESLKKFNNKKLLSKISSILQKFILSYQDYKDKKLILFFFFLLTLLEIFIGICINYFVALSFGVNIELTFFIAYVPIMMLLVRIPISLNGFGVNEGGAAFFLAMVGIPKIIGFSIALVEHFVNIIGILPGAFFYIFERDSKKVSFKKELMDEAA
ncbi:MAG: lysylphosphatidylglycerol synthase transmembrane domain-containing protein [Ignavibacteriaceae bacterium]